jgi:hypothetical protein
MNQFFWFNQILLFVFPILFIILNYRREGYIISLPVFFNAYSMLYFFFGFYYYYVEIFYYNAPLVFYEVQALSVAAMFAFNFSYLFFSRSGAHKAIIYSGYIPSREIVILCCVIGVVSHLVLIALSGGDFFSIGRVERFALLKDNRLVLLLSNFLILAMAMSFARYYYTRDQRDYIFAKFLVVGVLFYAVMTISRTYMTVCLIISLYYMERLGRVNAVTIVILMFFSAVSLFFFKGILYEIILGDSGYEKFNPGEFINWIRNSMMILNDDIPSVYLPDNSYLLTLESLFNPMPNGQAISEWFIEYYYPGRASAGLTYGFSGVAEGYIYLGYAGTILHFMFIGFAFSVVSKRNGFIYGILTVVAMILMFRLFRSEIYNFVKTFSWYYLYPMILLIFVDRVFLIKKSRSVT